MKFTLPVAHKYGDNLRVRVQVKEFFFCVRARCANFERRLGDEILAAANELKTEGRKRKKKKEPDNDHDDHEDDLLLWGYSTLGETKKARRSRRAFDRTL